MNLYTYMLYSDRMVIGKSGVGPNLTVARSQWASWSLG